MGMMRGVQIRAAFGAKIVAPWMMGVALLAVTLFALHDVAGTLGGGGLHLDQPMSWVIAQANPGRWLAVILLILGLVANWFTLLFVSIMFHLRSGKVFRWGLQALSFAMWLIVILVLVAPPFTQWRDALAGDMNDSFLGALLVLVLCIGGLVLVTCAVFAQRRPVLGMACLIGLAGVGVGVAGELGMTALPGVTSRVGAYLVQGAVLALAYAGYLIQMYEPQIDPEADVIRYEERTVEG